MISAEPAMISSAGKVRRRSKSINTAEGSWKAPTRFLPAAVLIPVLPPTAASTIANKVVGTWMTLMPRIQVAATKPAISVTAPPPRPTIASVREKFSSPRRSHNLIGVATCLPASASGTSSTTTCKPSACKCLANCAAGAAMLGWCTTITLSAPVAFACSAMRASRPWSMTTS